ncbi:MAG: Xanthine/uracil/vitamin permease [Deltaproteobacteria bacterium]|nr:Xanthine/uracil/vitamin permease [Deltaproteobacteria bacterium]
MKPNYIYNLDDHPPIRYALLYGFQWAMIMFPGLIIAASLSVGSFPAGALDKVYFLQMTLLTSGLFTWLQTSWGHRYPLLEGPSTALMLAFILLAPLGLATIQGGMILGAVLLILTVLSRQLDRVTVFFTPNVIGVILMLVSLGLIRPLIGFMTGGSSTDGGVFLISVFLVLLIASLSHWLQGFWKTVSILLGMILGSLLFYFLDRMSFIELTSSPWLSLSLLRLPASPGLHWQAVIAFACAYLAVMVNSLGSLQGIAVITDQQRLRTSIRRGLLFNGLAGICCGIFGVVGTVSFSMSPGVVLVLRVASRYAVGYCGLFLFAAAFFPKLAALLSLVPAPVVGAALCVGLGGQVGIGIATVASQPLSSRDYFVVGVPVLLGTMVAFLPQTLFDALPGSLQIFVGNSLITGIFLVLILEHLLLRNKKAHSIPPAQTRTT